MIILATVSQWVVGLIGLAAMILLGIYFWWKVFDAILNLIKVKMLFLEWVWERARKKGAKTG